MNISQNFNAEFAKMTISSDNLFRYDAVYHDDHDFNSVRPVPDHPLFKNNLGVANSIKLGHCNKYFNSLKPCKKEGVFDTLVYLGKFNLLLWSTYR